MSIKEIEKNGKSIWQVKVSLRSSLQPSIRVQRRVTEVDGEPIKTEAQAKKVEKKLKQQVKQEIFQKENAGATWKEIVKTWQKELLNGTATDKPLTQNTVNDYIYMVKTYTPDWKKRQANGITKADVKLVFNKVKTVLSNSSVNRMRSALNCVFQWAIENQRVKGMVESPARGIRIDYKKREKKPEVLSYSEQKKLLLAAKEAQHSWYPVWVVALYTGMRNGELYALKWSRVDFENRLIYVEESYNTRERKTKSTKAGYWRQVPMSPELYGFLKDLKANSKECSFVLPRLPKWDKGEQARILRTFLKEIGIRPVKFHALRGSFATELMRQGVAPATVRKICGWEDSETMEYYMDLAAIGLSGATDGLKIMPVGEAINKASKSLETAS